MTQPIRNFEYQKEKARKIKKRVDQLQDSIKELEKVYELAQEHDHITVPNHVESFNNELYDLAYELHNMEVILVKKLEIE